MVTQYFMQGYVSYLGDTYRSGSASLGRYSNSESSRASTYFCIGLSCEPDTLTNDLHYSAQLSVATTLVRNVVPIPAAVWLFISGLVVLGGFRRQAV
jgi:hypothetical protein